VPNGSMRLGSLEHLPLNFWQNKVVLPMYTKKIIVFTLGTFFLGTIDKMVDYLIYSSNQ